MMSTLVIPTDATRVAGPPQGHWTYTDWERLPADGNRYEIIDGALFMSTAPSTFHQWIVQRLYRRVGIPAEDHYGAFAFLSPVGLIMPGCDPVQPDFVLVLKAKASIIRDRRIYGVPDLIIEVLSPSSVSYDTEVKLHAYARAAVPEYAIIDPAARTLHLYTLETGAQQYGEPLSAGEHSTVTFACLPSLPLPVASLFAGAPDTTL